MKRKLLGVFLCFCMVFTLLPMTAFAAEETVDTWDGTVDTSWYNSNDVKDSYKIATAEQLAGLAQIVNEGDGKDFAGKTFYLQNDLDLSGHEWTAIGYLPTARDGTTFYGNFDGQGHEIRNMTTTSKKIHSQLGLFGGVNGGTISNLYVTNANIVNTDEMYAGILACQTYQATIKNCSVSGTLKTSPLGGVNAGGLIGFAQSSTKIIGCSSSATIIDYVTTWTGNAIGGIVGAWTHTDNQNGLLSDCYFNGEIIFSEESDVEFGKDGLTGGILGYHYTSQAGTGDVVVNNCMVATSRIENAYTKSGEGNPPVWVMYNTESTTPQSCYWPNSTDGWTAAVIDLESDPKFIDNCGSSVKNFKDDTLLDTLKAHADPNVNWVMGMEHPTFGWDERNISANYDEVEEAVKKAESLDAGLYTNYVDVTTAIEAVDWNKCKLEQVEVDEMAQKILDAINALEYKPADYSKVEKAVEKAQGLNKGEYQDFSKVEAAIKAVIEGKNITEQAVVDGYAAAIENAIAQLQYKDADYSKVEEAIEKAEALNKNEYQDFSKVEEAINAVVYGKNITEQAEVDAMAKAIDDAVSALEKKPEQTTDKENPESSDFPQTGDNIPMIPIIMMVAAVCGITVFSVVSYRRKKSE